jgi:hypothetical protein
MADETAELAYLVGSLADETSSEWANEPMYLYPERYPNTQKLTEAEMKVQMNQSLPWPIILKTEAREQPHRAEPKRAKRARRARARARIAADAPQGAIPSEAAHTSAELFGSMADETERELSTAQGAGEMGTAHGQAPPEAAQGA